MESNSFAALGLLERPPGSLLPLERPSWYLCSMLHPGMCWCPWSMLPPRLCWCLKLMWMDMLIPMAWISMVCAITGAHIDSPGLCCLAEYNNIRVLRCHLRTSWCPCISLAAAGQVDVLLQPGPCGFPWPMWPPKATRVSVVCAATWNHVYVRGLCCG